jgi:hypothetical protein
MDVLAVNRATPRRLATLIIPTMVILKNDQKVIVVDRFLSSKITRKNVWRCGVSEFGKVGVLLIQKIARNPKRFRAMRVLKNPLVERASP